MRSSTDPILAWRRRLGATTLLGAAAFAACAWWALRAAPPAPPRIDLMQVPADPETKSSALLGADVGAKELDEVVFGVPLWNPPPKVQAPAPATEERVEPLRLQLVGIVHTAQGRRAALYDPLEDRLHLVADGETVGRIGVLRVAGDLVELADGRRTHVLRMREEDAAAPPRPGARR